MDFSRLRWNPMDVPIGKKVLDHFEELSNFPVLKSSPPELDGDKCLRFAMLMSDPATPLSNIGDFSEMLSTAAELAGFKKTAGTFHPNVMAMLNWEVGEVSDMVHQLFVIHSNYKYDQWFTMKQNYHHISKFLKSPPNNVNSKELAMEMKNRMALQNDLEETAENIAKKESSMFGNEYLKKAILMGVAKRMDMYPERLAKQGVAI